MTPQQTATFWTSKTKAARPACYADPITGDYRPYRNPSSRLACFREWREAYRLHGRDIARELVLAAANKSHSPSLGLWVERPAPQTFRPYKSLFTRFKEGTIKLWKA